MFNVNIMDIVISAMFHNILTCVTDPIGNNNMKRIFHVNIMVLLLGARYSTALLAQNSQVTIVVNAKQNSTSNIIYPAILE